MEGLSESDIEIMRKTELFNKEFMIKQLERIIKELRDENRELKEKNKKLEDEYY